MAAERNVASRFVGRQAALRLEPLAVGIDQGDVRDRHVEHVGRELHDPVEPLLGRRIEQPQGGQIGQTILFVGGKGGGEHGGIVAAGERDA